MRHVSYLPSERFVTCSSSIVFDCRCGEKLVLLGHESDWRKEERTTFECGGCGENISLYEPGGLIGEARRLFRRAPFLDVR